MNYTYLFFRKKQACERQECCVCTLETKLDRVINDASGDEETRLKIGTDFERTCRRWLLRNEVVIRSWVADRWNYRRVASITRQVPRGEGGPFVQVDTEVVAQRSTGPVPGIRSSDSPRLASPRLCLLARERRYHIGEDERPARVYKFVKPGARPLKPEWH